ncbi:MAG: bifunctional methylenetetrahydrofolate dehydrogenase/methenyltetrahydrofolate cyclohydrolase FolD [Negativicutes bacterium]|nr:bifunctional methylenetetrahydrofolate dehydrogenase/methenyltetrahydrofolate cyclohydrolase FolD [Negativicutes bacterium]
MAEIIDGRAIAETIKADVARRAAWFSRQNGRPPGLAVVMVGDDPASQVYVGNKHRACSSCGIYSEIIRLPADTGQDQLTGVVENLNRREEIHGILVQMPLPQPAMARAVIDTINPVKDVDGFHPYNAGCLAGGYPTMVPCTPRGVMKILSEAGIDPTGRHAVVVGRSTIVGKPLAQLLLQADCTVTVCHTRTAGLAAFTRQADILVAAAGRPEFIGADMVRPGAVVIDVGINRRAGRLVGDVDFAAVATVAGHITPVPGGVGPLTIAMLLDNTLIAAGRQMADGG